MKRHIILLGVIDKKLIWPFLYSFTQILQTILNREYPMDKQSISMNSFGIAVGQILNFIIPYIIRHKGLKHEKNCTKKNVLHYFFLIVINGIFYVLLTINMQTKKAVTNPHDSTFCTNEAFEIVFITLITFVFLKYRYFNHHIISLIIFSSISIAIDLLLDGFEENFNNKTPLQKSLEIIIILVESLNYCYQKYMMNKFYHHYWNINTVLGISVLIGLFSYKMTSFEKFSKEFDDVGIGYIILSFFINIILGFATLLTRILTLDYQTPNHMLIAYDITKIFIVLTQSENEYKWYSIIFFVFQFFFLMFYLEILEFNFCNLNKNTKRNIGKRLDEEEIINDPKDFHRESSVFEYDGYFMKTDNDNNQQLEMDIFSSDNDSRRDSNRIN